MHRGKKEINIGTFQTDSRRKELQLDSNSELKLEDFSEKFRIGTTEDESLKSLVGKDNKKSSNNQRKVGNEDRPRDVPAAQAQRQNVQTNNISSSFFRTIELFPIIDDLYDNEYIQR